MDKQDEDLVQKKQTVWNRSLQDSFKNALNGLYTSIRSEKNVRIHLLATLFIFILGFILGLDLIEFALIALTCAIVIIAELFNTVIEYLVDFVCNEYNEKAKVIKDISAGAVLVTAVAALVVAMFIILPKIWQLI